MLQFNRVVSQFRFNLEARRFVASNGQFVARETVRAAARSISEAAGREMESASQKFFDGQITHVEWDAAMRLNLRRAFAAEGMVAGGGRAQMTPRMWGRVGALLKKQYQFLNGFGIRIRDGTYGDNLEKNGFLAVARQYQNAARVAFERMDALNNIEELGHTTVENILSPLEQHCEGDGSCPSISELGPVSPDDEAWLWPGDRLCRGACGCGVKTA